MKQMAGTEPRALILAPAARVTGPVLAVAPVGPADRADRAAPAVSAASGWNASSRGAGSPGVCAGLADYLGVDANLIRVIVAVLVLFGGFGALVYVLAWALVPEEGESVSIAEKIINKNGASGGQG